MKQTAIEWYDDQLNEIDFKLQSQLINFEECKALMSYTFELAKQMEKEQHNETWDSAHQAGRFEGKGIAEENWQTFETYWEETFKSE
jgi:hypothetical protein